MSEEYIEKEIQQEIENKEEEDDDTTEEIENEIKKEENLDDLKTNENEDEIKKEEINENKEEVEEKQENNENKEEEIKEKEEQINDNKEEDDENIEEIKIEEIEEKEEQINDNKEEEKQNGEIKEKKEKKHKRKKTIDETGNKEKKHKRSMTKDLNEATINKEEKRTKTKELTNDDEKKHKRKKTIDETGIKEKKHQKTEDLKEKKDETKSDKPKKHKTRDLSNINEIKDISEKKHKTRDLRDESKQLHRSKSIETMKIEEKHKTKKPTRFSEQSKTIKDEKKMKPSKSEGLNKGGLESSKDSRTSEKKSRREKTKSMMIERNPKIKTPKTSKEDERKEKRHSGLKEETNFDESFKEDKKIKRSNFSESFFNKKNIELTIEIGHLLQCHIKNKKCFEYITVKREVNKYLMQVKDEYTDDIIVYSQTGELINQEETLGNLTSPEKNNKVYLLITKKSKRYAKKINFDIMFDMHSKKVNPQIVYDLSRWIYIYGIEVEGLFRISGNNELIKKKLERVLKQSTDFLNETSHGVVDIHNTVGVLKSYLRESTTGLFDLSIPEEILKLEGNERDEKLFEEIDKLDKNDKLSLCIILNLAQTIIQKKKINSMGVGNVAIVFGPMLIHSHGAISFGGTEIQLQFAVYLIKNATKIREHLKIDTFFEFNESEIEYDNEQTSMLPPSKKKEEINENEQKEEIKEEKITNELEQQETQQQEQEEDDDIIDRFAYDISDLDDDLKEFAKDIAGWMQEVLSDDDESSQEAIKWIHVYHTEHNENFIYIVNMLTSDFVLSVMEKINNYTLSQ